MIENDLPDHRKLDDVFSGTERSGVEARDSATDVDMGIASTSVTPPVDATSLRVPLVEETLDTQVVQRQIGSVLIHKHIETQTLRNEVELYRDDVALEQHMVEEYVEEKLDPWYEGETLVIPVYEEVLVTERKLMLTKLVRLRRTERVENAVVEGDVRREVLDFESRSTGN